MLGKKPVAVSLENLQKAAHMPSQVKNLVRVAALVDSEFSTTSLQGTGWRIVNSIKSIVILEGEMSSVPFLRAIPGLLSVEYGKDFHPCMDSARRETHINEMQGSVPSSLTRNFSGKGVIFGILDNEFDTHQPAFLDSLGHTRFIALWDQTDKSNAQPNRFGYGRIKKGIDVDKDTLFGSDSNEYHGTHMASCGAGYDKNFPQYAGAASNSQIVAVKYGNSSADFMNGLSWVFSIADSLKKPCVVNMSIGLASGPHDGTSLMDKTIDSLAGTGHIIVGAAGNDGSLKEHVGFSLNAKESKGTWVEAGQSQVSATQTTGFSVIDIWGESGKPFSDTVYIIDKRNMSYKKSGNALSTADRVYQYLIDTLRWPDSVSGPDTLIFQAIVEKSNAANRKPHMELALYSSNASLVLGVKVYSALATTINGWNAEKLNCNSLGIAGFIDGDSLMTINEVGGTAKSIISVGGYNSKVSPLRYDGTVFGAGDTTLYDYLSYTSLGPTADGRIKPDISAPGREVTGAMTRFIVDKGGRTAVWPNPPSMIGRYAFLGGTSISSPIVAGIIAGMLEYDSKLTPATVLQALQKSAIKDRFTNLDIRWGAGKVNAEGALASLGVVTKASNPRLLNPDLLPDIAIVLKKNRLKVCWKQRNGVQTQATAGIYDIAGKQLWAGMITNNRSTTLPMNVKTGSFFLRIRLGNGSQIVRPVINVPW